MSAEENTHIYVYTLPFFYFFFYSYISDLLSHFWQDFFSQQILQ